MRFIDSIILCACCSVVAIGCGDAPCSGPACRIDVATPSDATATPSVEWGGAAESTTDCNNNGGVAEADRTTLFYAEETLADTPHEAIVNGSLRVNQPILVWRSVCNKSDGGAGALTVDWSRAPCVNANDCSSPISLGTSAIAAQANCLCEVAFLEDRIGDDAGEVAGLYRYALSFSGTEIANAVVRVE